MSLPPQAVDRLFERLTLVYGAEFARRFDGLDMRDVKAQWGAELAAFASRLGAIAWALEHLPERAPNVIAFRELCRQAPRDPSVPLLPEAKLDPARVAAELAKLGPMVKSAAVKRPVNVEWARRVLAEPKRYSVSVIAMAERALARVGEGACADA